jgi:hypothetical protein
LNVLSQVRLDGSLFQQPGPIGNPAKSELIQQQAQGLLEIHAAADIVKRLEGERTHELSFAVSSVGAVVSVLNTCLQVDASAS